ncbi:ABC transporter substrate-binding protein [Krasilnikoviella flava]|uniref:Substrate-binding protein n=1 Tax=Krasilnikoviella flava TaxID=526729 RepID=A0A1T5K2V0_9MICO|nr:ABC transporter substrate-binding protein [Krasilnikoviella flava]SKC57880.1 substrate-binding protein [Krasilnikoviella flava]
MSPTRTVAALGTALLALSLTACGSAGAADDGASSAAEGDGGTRTVESTFTGEDVEIPADPQRVVALWRTGTELAELGVVPVASLEDEFLPEELGERYDAVADVPTVGTWEGVDIEKLIAAEPDLIIGMDNGSLGIDYEEISQVAPTVILDIAEPTDVWANYPTVADLVGRATDSDERQKALDAELAAIEEEHGDVLTGLEATHLSTMDGIWVSTSKSLAYQRLTGAGFGYNPAYTENPERYVTELATENLPDLAGQDALFYAVNLDGSVDAPTQEILDSASWQRLPAVEAGHAFPMTSGTIYTFDAAEQQVEDLRAAAETLAADR